MAVSKPMEHKHHQHIVPLSIGTALVAYGLLEQFWPAGGAWNWVVTGVATFLLAGLWHDKMCKMG